MFCLYNIIINPIAGNGASLGYLEKVEAVLARRGLTYRIDRSEERGAIMLLAKQIALEGSDAVIIMGGDGSIFECINGLVGSSIPLLFVPCGTGNDFVRSLKLPSDPIVALEAQLDADVCCIDIGKMNDMYFLNVSGTGFDVEVLRNADKYKARYRGLRPYLRGLVDALKSYKPMTASISFDGEPEQTTRFTILSIGNGRYFGGGMKAVPYALVDDGLFDVVIVRSLPRFLIPVLLIFFITGTHVLVHLGKLTRCRNFSLRCEGMTLNLDGELRNVNSASYELIPNALAVRLPKQI